MKESRLVAFAGILLCLSVLCRAQESDQLLEKLTRSAYGHFLNNPDRAIIINRKALTIAVRENNRYYEGMACFVFSKVYWVKANYRLSTEYGFRALRIFEKSEHKMEYARTLLSVARTLVELRNFATARQLLDQASGIGNILNNDEIIAGVYRELSYWFAEKSILDSALIYTDKGIGLYESLHDTLDASILYSRKARILFQLKDFEQSRAFALRGLAMDTLVSNYRGLGVSHFLVAQNELALKNFAEAELHLKHSIRISLSIGNLAWLIKAYELLAEIYYVTKRPMLAAEQFKNASQLKDSLYNAAKSGQIQEMRSLYELEGKENQIKLLERENELKAQVVKNQQLFLGFLSVGLLLLLVVIFFLARLRILQRQTNRTLQAKNEAIQQQREELQTQAEKLQQLNLLQNKLFSVISHDLRGPIGNLHSLLELLTRQLLSQEEFLKVSEKLRSNLNVTQRTLENMLNWALSQMDGLKTQKRILDIGKSIEEAWRLLEDAAAKKLVQVEKTWTHVHLAQADADQVELVLRNLIHNAIKFSKIGDKISVSIREDHTHCMVCIEDTGVGMSQEEIDLIMGAPRHFSKVGTQQEKGTGLGLLLCKEFVERNDGKLHITSKIGEGTRVCFSLPVA